MATLQDIGVSAFINILSAFAFLLAFALLRIQPINDRVYFPKWYTTGARGSPSRSGNLVKNFVNLDFWTYITFLSWMPQALNMSEEKLIAHAGLDSAAFLRIYTLGLKIFLPTAIVAILVLIPINVSSGMLFFLRKELVFSDIDKLSISNVQPQSERFFIHIGMEYLFTLWTCYMLYKEYGAVALMRLNYLATQSARPEQFTVLVRNVPHVHGQSVSDTVENFFKDNHPEHYLCHQSVYNANRYAKFARRKHRLQNWMDYNRRKFERHPNKKPNTRNGFLGICGQKVDAIDFYEKKIGKIERRMTLERQRILKDPKSTLPVSFVSFNSRWGAAVCAQTQQSRNPTLWLTDWAPEPQDVYWKNLSITFFSLSIRKLVISLSVFALIFCYMVPIAFVQSLANLDGLERVAPFLKSVIERKYIKSFLQGFLPGLALKIFLYILPTVLMIMSKIEGHAAVSLLERKAAAKYYYFMLVNVFLGTIVTGTAFEQLHSFLHQSPTQIPRTIGVSIPMKATFFITYIMVDGWAAMASEILRLKPLIIFHLKNLFLVKTERDKERAMDPGSINFPETIPSLQFYFLIGSVYAVVTPILLPFILIFFALAYFIYRHQIINVYNQQYESVAAFWPHVHTRIIASLLISQLLLLGLLSTKEAANSTPLLLILPIFTLSFHVYCKHRFEPAFRRYPLEEAMAKDKQERSSERDRNLISLLDDAYLHPIFDMVDVDKEAGPCEPIRVDTNPQKMEPPPIPDHHHPRVTDPSGGQEHHDPPYSATHYPPYEFEAADTFTDYDNPDAYISTSSSPPYHYPDFGYHPKVIGGAHEDIGHS